MVSLLCCVGISVKIEHLRSTEQKYYTCRFANWAQFRHCQSVRLERIHSATRTPWKLLSASCYKHFYLRSTSTQSALGDFTDDVLSINSRIGIAFITVATLFLKCILLASVQFQCAAHYRDCCSKTLANMHNATFDIFHLLLICTLCTSRTIIIFVKWTVDHRREQGFVACNSLFCPQPAWSTCARNRFS